MRTAYLDPYPRAFDCRVVRATLEVLDVRLTVPGLCLPTPPLRLGAGVAMEGGDGLEEMRQPLSASGVSLMGVARSN
jgi:hypothetical protein